MQESEKKTESSPSKPWSETLSGRTIVFTAVMGLFVLVFWIANRRPASLLGDDRETVRLSIPAEALNFGTVWEDEKFEWTLPVENHEVESIEVESFRASCDCLSIKPKSFVIGPGERRELILQIDLTLQRKPSGNTAVTLYPRLKTTPGTELAKRRSLGWTVKGQVRRALALDRKVYLGRHSEFSQPFPARSIRVEVLAPLKSLSVECSSPSFAAAVELPSGGEGKTMLQFTPTASLPIGSFQGTVRLKGVRIDGETLSARTLEFSGTIVSDVEAVPPTVQVGGRRLGETFEEVVVLRSMTGKALGSVRVEAEGEGLSVEVAKESGGYCIRQKVCREGAQSNRVRFMTESCKHPVTIVVPVSYTGIEVK